MSAWWAVHGLMREPCEVMRRTNSLETRLSYEEGVEGLKEAA